MQRDDIKEAFEKAMATGDFEALRTFLEPERQRIAKRLFFNKDASIPPSFAWMNECLTDIICTARPRDDKRVRQQFLGICSIMRGIGSDLPLRVVIQIGLPRSLVEMINLPLSHDTQHNNWSHLLDIAVEERSPACLAAIVRNGVDVNTADENGYTALLYAASLPLPSRHLINVLLGLGADIRATTNRGESLLHVMSGANAEFLLQQGLNVDERGECNETPLMAVAHAAKPNISLLADARLKIQCLLAAGANISPRMMDHLSRTLYDEEAIHPDIRKMIADERIKRGDSDARKDKDRARRLLAAVRETMTPDPAS